MRKIAITLFIITLFLSQISLHTFAKEINNETIIIAGSDFQHHDGNEAGKNEVSQIITAIKNDGIRAADALLFCGDYDYDTYGDETSVIDGVNSIKDATSEFVKGQIILAQGNHDTASGTNGLTVSGANDPVTKAYGVYVINNDDYMWKNSDEATIKKTSENLKNYLNEKLTENYNRPIFIVSHLSLHYSMRTANDGDGIYANYLFDVINSAAEKGLNIIFLFGHNHSNGWDDYLGGSSVFLKGGDKILIAQGDKSTFKEETLAFTYINAGYVGYYKNHNGADDTLTMTVFSINDNKIEICRYSKDGKHPLKSAGKTNNYKNETLYSPNTMIYKSPQTILLNIDHTPSKMMELLPYLIIMFSVALITSLIIVAKAKRKTPEQ